MVSAPETLNNLLILNTDPTHAVGVSETVREAFGVGPREACDDCMTPAHVQAQIRRFPAGQFSAIVTGDKVVGMAATMRTSRGPSEKALSWMAAIGDLKISAHEAAGEWLYGVEMAVRPAVFVDAWHRNALVRGALSTSAIAELARMVCGGYVNGLWTIR